MHRNAKGDSVSAVRNGSCNTLPLKDKVCHSYPRITVFINVIWHEDKNEESFPFASVFLASKTPPWGAATSSAQYYQSTFKKTLSTVHFTACPACFHRDAALVWKDIVSWLSLFNLAAIRTHTDEALPTLSLSSHHVKGILPFIHFLMHSN